MQTFLPYFDFLTTARCLDYRRLGKQRVETLQILKALKHGGAWSNHPATLMWKGFENALAEYGNYTIAEWIRRGYKNTMKFFPINGEIVYPSWLGLDSFHSSHRAALLFKNPTFYKNFNWKESPELSYIWPLSGVHK